MIQVIVNFITNANKFIPMRGKIEITVNPFPSSNIINIEVEDNGVGIPEDQLKKIG